MTETRISLRPVRPALVLLALVLWVFAGAARAQAPVVVFAAASLKEALDEVAEGFEAATGIKTSRAYGGSSSLARQIRYGAPAQVFVSANEAWMDALGDEGLLAAGRRVDLLGNRLVLVTAADSPLSVAPRAGADLAGALGEGRLAMALVDAVPAGIYGRAALQSLGLWEQVRERIAQTDNVRAALRLVAAGEAPLGIVYATDAAAEPKVRVLGVFPAGSHPPVIYPAALLARGQSDAAQAFFDYLRGPGAHAVFRAHGFITPAEAGG